MKKDFNITDALNKDILNDAFPESPAPNLKTNDVIYSLTENSPKGMDVLTSPNVSPSKLQKITSICW